MLRVISLWAAGALAAAAMPAAAETDDTTSGGLLEDRLAIGISVGTAGVGPEIQYRIHPRIVLRGGYSYLKFGVDDEYDDVEYDADLNTSSFVAAVDVHPFKGSFFLSGGAYIGGKSVDLEARPDSDVEIGDETFTPAEVGTLRGEAELKTLAPFAGLGFDNTYRGGRIGFKAMAGVMFTGSPEASLSSSGGTLSSDPTLRAALREEEQSLEEDIEDYKLYPLLTLGATYRF